ncbi:glycoside hydrolase family 16 protein, partial [bacterium]|nr:glycoside hydrolase family 16 protein [bacterium]
MLPLDAADALAGVTSRRLTEAGEELIVRGRQLRVRADSRDGERGGHPCRGKGRLQRGRGGGVFGQLVEVEYVPRPLLREQLLHKRRECRLAESIDCQQIQVVGCERATPHEAHRPDARPVRTAGKRQRGHQPLLVAGEQDVWSVATSEEAQPVREPRVGKKDRIRRGCNELIPLVAQRVEALGRGHRVHRQSPRRHRSPPIDTSPHTHTILDMMPFRDTIAATTSVSLIHALPARICLCVLVSVTILAAPTGCSQSYKPEGDLVFAEEFEGASLDRTVWNTEMVWGRKTTGELQRYEDSCAEVGDGRLRIVAKEQQSDDRRYASGVIASFDRFEFTYGYAEMRARMPEGQGLWPAFWLASADTASGSEIDVVEFLGHEPNTMHMA